MLPLSSKAITAAPCATAAGAAAKAFAIISSSVLGGV
jgi:hypothetical protein